MRSIRPTLKRKDFPYPKGFTFPELVIAVAVLAIAIVGLLSAVVSALLVNNRARDLIRATMHAQYILEHIQSQESADDIDTLLATYDGDPYDWMDLAIDEALIPETSEILSQENIEVNLINSETIDSSKLYTIEVVIEWQDYMIGVGSGTNRSISFTTEISR